MLNQRTVSSQSPADRVAAAEARLAQQRRLLCEARGFGSQEWVKIAENSCIALETALACFRMELTGSRQDRS